MAHPRFAGDMGLFNGHDVETFSHMVLTPSGNPYGSIWTRNLQDSFTNASPDMTAAGSGVIEVADFFLWGLSKATAGPSQALKYVTLVSASNPNEITTGNHIVNVDVSSQPEVRTELALPRWLRLGQYGTAVPDTNPSPLGMQFSFYNPFPTQWGSFVFASIGFATKLTVGQASINVEGSFNTY